MIQALLIGYGRMGSEIARLAPQLNIAVTTIVDRSADGCNKTVSKELLNLCDVVIDFSSPKDILERTALISEAKKPYVIGTTGWNEQLDKAKKIVHHNSSAALFSPNFSLGVALFLHLASQASSLMSHFPSYDVGIAERHHRKKADGPGGTALNLAKKVLESYPEKTLCTNPSPTSALEKEALHVSWQRVGSFPGTHELIFDSPEDTIALSHTARTREGFARGALEAAFWLLDKKGFFTLDDMIRDKLQKTRS